jgi:hypothetical protein
MATGVPERALCAVLAHRYPIPRQNTHHMSRVCRHQAEAACWQGSRRVLARPVCAGS